MLVIAILAWPEVICAIIIAIRLYGEGQGRKEVAGPIVPEGEEGQSVFYRDEGVAAVDGQGASKKSMAEEEEDFIDASQFCYSNTYVFACLGPYPQMVQPGPPIRSTSI